MRVIFLSLLIAFAVHAEIACWQNDGFGAAAKTQKVSNATACVMIIYEGNTGNTDSKGDTGNATTNGNSTSGPLKGAAPPASPPTSPPTSEKQDRRFIAVANCDEYIKSIGPGAKAVCCYHDYCNDPNNPGTPSSSPSGSSSPNGSPSPSTPSPGSISDSTAPSGNDQGGSGVSVSGGKGAPGSVRVTETVGGNKTAAPNRFVNNIPGSSAASASSLSLWCTLLISAGMVAVMN